MKGKINPQDKAPKRGGQRQGYRGFGRHGEEIRDGI